MTSQTIVKLESEEACDEWANAEAPKTMLRIVWEQFLRHRAAKWSLLLLTLLIAMTVAAPLITRALGIDEEQQNVLNRYKPFGTVAEMSSQQQEKRLQEFSAEKPELVAKLAEQAKAAGLVDAEEESGEVVFLLSEKVSNEADFSDKIVALNSSEGREFLAFKKSLVTRYWLGTDELGRDVLARLLHGARVTLSVGALVSLSASLIGLILGATAGYFGGWVDAIIMRVVDSLLALPSFPLQILLAAVDLKKLPILKDLLSGESESIVKILFVLVAFGWMSSARLVRGQVLSVKENEFILAAKTIGAHDFRIIFSHVVPNVLGTLVVQITLGAASAMMAETGLSFLGLGIQPPMPSWGNMLNNAMELVNSAPFLAFAPGFMIFVVTICVNFVGDGLRDAIDPKAIRR